jgi:hypothetical protein
MGGTGGRSLFPAQISKKAPIKQTFYWGNGEKNRKENNNLV